MRTAARRDKNEKAIIAVLKAAGWHVKQCSDEGLPDLYCLRKDSSGAPRPMWLEVKTAGGTLRPAQRDLWTAWEAMGLRVYVLEDAEHAEGWLEQRLESTDWHLLPVDERGRGAKKPKPKRWIPERIRNAGK